VFEATIGVAIKATQKGPPNTAGDHVIKRCGL